MNDHSYSFANAVNNTGNKKGKKSSLQFLFSDLANGTIVHHLPDRRNVGVSKNASDRKNATTGTDAEGAKRNGSNDGLLGSLLLEHFLSSVLCPFFPVALQALDISNAVDAVDEFWMDRREARPAAPEISYFPSYC